MKKYIISAALFTAIGVSTQAQVSEGGLPLTFRSAVDLPYIPKLALQAPKISQLIKEDKANKGENFLDDQNRVGKIIAADFSYPSSGVFTQLVNGQTIWTAQIYVKDAPAIGMYFTNFHLPAGAKLFISNGNQKQVLGAFTSANSYEDGIFTVEPLQGEIAQIELNLDPGVNSNLVTMTLNEIGVWYKSIDYLNTYADITQIDEAQRPTDFLDGTSSTCHINAICQQGNSFEKQKKATVQVFMKTGDNINGFCSATMINNTGNTKTTCKQYVLLASHCDGLNSRQNSNFATWLFRYNFERVACNSATPVLDSRIKTMTGANFVARSNYTGQPITGDFLLVELRNKVPASYDAYLSGWNNDPNKARNVKHIGFHHPAGDVKKLSVFNSLINNNDPYDWSMNVSEGGIEGGTSGSGLFDNEGYYVGTASTAGSADANCKNTLNGSNDANFFKYVNYSKISNNWEYADDEDEDYRRLKPWLDPKDSGIVKLGSIKADCSDFGELSLKKYENELASSVSVFPVPTNNSIVNVKFNLKEIAKNVVVDIVNITGSKVASYSLANVQTQSIAIDVAHLANGVYFMNVNDGANTTTKKVVLSK